MVKNAKTLGGAGLLVAIGIVVMVVTDLTIVGLVIALVGIVGLFLLLRAPSSTEEAFLDTSTTTDRPTREAPADDEDAESLGAWEETDTLTWETDEESGDTWGVEETTSETTAWEVEDAAGDTWEVEETASETVSWEAEDAAGDTWEVEETTTDTLTWEAEDAAGDTWEVEETTSETTTWETEDADDGFETFESLSFGEDEAEAPAPSSTGLFSVAAPIDEDVHSDDDIMAASQATELHVEPEVDGDNSELAKLLAKVQSRLAAYE